jgi:hypothetical protein
VVSEEIVRGRFDSIIRFGIEDKEDREGREDRESSSLSSVDTTEL